MLGMVIPPDRALVKVRAVVSQREWPERNKHHGARVQRLTGRFKAKCGGDPGVEPAFTAPTNHLRAAKAAGVRHQRHR